MIFPELVEGFTFFVALRLARLAQGIIYYCLNLSKAYPQKNLRLKFFYGINHISKLLFGHRREIGQRNNMPPYPFGNGSNRLDSGFFQIRMVINRLKMNACGNTARVHKINEFIALPNLNDIKPPAGFGIRFLAWNFQPRNP